MRFRRRVRVRRVSRRVGRRSYGRRGGRGPRRIGYRM